MEGKLNISVLRQFVVLFVAHRFKPLVGRVFARHFHGDVRKPAVFFCAVPVFYAYGDFHAVARFKGAGFFAPLLIPAFAGDAQQNLSPLSARCTCQLLRQPGSKVTFAKNGLPADGVLNGLRYDVPIKYLA